MGVDITQAELTAMPEMAKPMVMIATLDGADVGKLHSLPMLSMDWPFFFGVVFIIRILVFSS